MQTADTEQDPRSQTPARLHIQHVVALVPPQTPLLCFVPSVVKSLPSFFRPFLSFIPSLICPAHQPGFSPAASPAALRPHFWKSQAGWVLGGRVRQQ